MKKVKLSFFYFFIFFSSKISAQPLQFHFENYSIANGLIDNLALGLFQDSHGFIWITSYNGLNRFDGISFQNFFQGKPGSNSLSGNTVYSIYEMHGGLILLATNNGLNIYNIKKNVFENWRVTRKELQPGSNTFIRAVFSDADKNIWISYNGVLDVYDSLFNYKFRFTDLPQGKILKGLVLDFNTQIDEKGNLWLAGKSIIKLEYKTLKVTCLKNSEDTIYKSLDIHSFYLDTLKHIVWYSPWFGGLRKYDLQTKKLITYMFPVTDRVVDSMSMNSLSGIIPLGDKLLCGSGGLIEFNTTNGSYIIHKHKDDNPFSIPTNGISSMIRDAKNNLWLGTSAGICKVNLIPGYFNYINEPFINNATGKTHSLFTFDIYNSDWLIVGTDHEGLFAYNMKTKKSEHVFASNKLNSGSNTFTQIYVDRKNNLWTSTYDNLFNYNPEKNKLTKPICNVPVNRIRAIYQDSQNDYWFGYAFDSVLVYCSKNNKNEFELKYFLNSKKEFPMDRVNTIVEDGNYNLWFTTMLAQGFAGWDRREKNFTHFPKYSDEETNLSESYSSLIPDKGGWLWLSSGTHGIIHYNYNTDKQVNYTTADGLVHDNVSSMVQDTTGTIWIGTERGLSQFNPVAKTFKNFDNSDGLPDINFMHKAIYDSTTHLIYMLTENSIVYFNPYEIKKQKSLPVPENIFIQRIQMNGSDTVFDFDKEISLPYNYNNINIEFTAINFNHGSQTHFAYRLEGLDKKWNYSGTRRFINYSNLAPGTYILKIKAANKDDVWSKEKAMATFIIRSPFYLTWWFIFLVAVVAAAAVYIVRDYRRRNRKAVVEVRERISRDLHDDIGSTLNSISIFSEIANQKNVEAGQREHYLKTIGSSSRDMIETMNDIVWSVNPLNDHFENVLLRMKGFAGEMADSKDIQLNFENRGTYSDISLSMDKRKNLYLIFKEAVNNAIKYSDCKNLIITTEISNGELKLTIRDDGKGFETEPMAFQHKNRTHEGNGLRNMHERAAEIKGIIEINSEKGKGSSVSLRLKV